MAAAWVLAAAAALALWAAAAEGARSPAARVHRHLKRLNKPAVKSIEVGWPVLENICFFLLLFLLGVIAQLCVVDALLHWEFKMLVFSFHILFFFHFCFYEFWSSIDLLRF
jgi:hypothetical protein